MQYCMLLVEETVHIVRALKKHDVQVWVQRTVYPPMHCNGRSMRRAMTSKKRRFQLHGTLVCHSVGPKSIGNDGRADRWVGEVQLTSMAATDLKSAK